MGSRPESVLLIHLAIGIRNIVGVDLTAEVALRRGDAHVGVISILGVNDIDGHFSLVADDGADGIPGKFGSALFEHGGHLGDVHDELFALWGSYSGSAEPVELEVDHDAFLRAGDQLGLRGLLRESASNHQESQKDK